MNISEHTTLWAECAVRFYRRKRDNDKYPLNTPVGFAVELFHGAARAESSFASSLTLFSPDWKEELRLTNYHFGFGDCHGGHNWDGVTRLDFIISPPATPFSWYGHLFTGGCNSTFKVHRYIHHHQVPTIPRKAVFTPLEDGVWHATWSIKRKACEIFTACAGRDWVFGSTPEQTIARAVYARLTGRTAQAA